MVKTRSLNIVFVKPATSRSVECPQVIPTARIPLLRSEPVETQGFHIVLRNSPESSRMKKSERHLRRRVTQVCAGAIPIKCLNILLAGFESPAKLIREARYL